MTPADSYTESVETFLAAATWLTDEDSPAVTTLLLLARELDTNGHHAQTVSAFGLAYRALLKRSPSAGADAVDPLEALLSGAE